MILGNLFDVKFHIRTPLSAVIDVVVQGCCSEEATNSTDGHWKGLKDTKEIKG